jgi:hypothetical protein
MLYRHVLPAKSVRPLVDAKEKGLNKIQLKKTHFVTAPLSC